MDRRPAGARCGLGAQIRQGPEVWLENRTKQREQQREVHTPLFAIFKPRFLGNTLLACWWMTSCFVTYYSIWALFATHLQKDLGLGSLMVGLPLVVANLLGFGAMCFWGWVGDVLGRRWSMMLPAFFGIFITPIYLLTTDHSGSSAGSGPSRRLPARCTVSCRAT